MRINEELLERYVRYPETLSEEECNEVQALLRESELARQIVAFYQDYYSELDELERGESEAVKSFVERILRTIQEDPEDRSEG